MKNVIILGARGNIVKLAIDILSAASYLSLSQRQPYEQYDNEQN